MNWKLVAEFAILLAMAGRSCYFFARAIGKIVDEMSEGYGQGELPKP